MLPTLSALMPNYNDAASIPKALEALLAQSVQPFEIIIVDDGSKDSSVEIIRSFADRYPHIRLIQNVTNRGVIFTINRALDEARGDYVIFTGSNDQTLPGFVEETMRMASQYPEAALIFGQMTAVDPKGRILSLVEVPAWRSRRFADPQTYLKEYLDRESPMHSLGGATVYRTQALREFGGFRYPELGHWCDTFVARAMGLKYGVCYIPQPFYRYVMEISSFSKKAMSDRSVMEKFVADAVRLMSSERFGPYFPEAHIRRWQKRALWHARFFSRPWMMKLLAHLIYSENTWFKASVHSIEKHVRRSCMGRV